MYRVQTKETCDRQGLVSSTKAIRLILLMKMGDSVSSCQFQQPATKKTSDRALSAKKFMTSESNGVL